LDSAIWKNTTYLLSVANTTNLGGVKEGGDINIDSSGIVTVKDDSHNHIISNIDNLQTTLDSKLTASNNLSDLTNAATARANLGVDESGTTNYTHPTYNGDDINLDTGSLTGATVISDLDFNVTTDTLGHVTDANATYSTRNITLANLGFTGDIDANNYSLPVASTTLGGIKSGTDITVDDSGNVSVKDDSHNHVISNVDGLQTALDSKLTASNNLSDLTNVATARSNLGVDASGTVNYSHPTYNSDDIDLDTGALAGATVISDLDFNVTTDTLGHVTDANATYSTKTLTKTDIGLSNVDNVQQIPLSQKGSNNGVAELDSSGLVPSSQLPSYVDDVLEYSTLTNFPTTGETGKIYITLDTNLTYRWTGTGYAEISASLALGETSSTAYRGDRGKISYDHSQLTSGNPHNVTKTDVGLSNVPNTDIAYSSPIAADDFTQTEVNNLRAGKLANGTTPWRWW
jgi:hypothetical protein